MVNQNTVKILSVLGLAMILAFQGCGHNGMGSGTDDTFSILDPKIESLNSRLQSHYVRVAGILGSAEEGISKLEADYRANSLSDEDWAAIHAEQEDYGQEMHRILNDLGETVTMIGACRMMIGGMMFGPEDIESECPCTPYMDTSSDELDRHLAEMLDRMDQGDMAWIWKEVKDHWEQMGSHISQMASHMQQTYGSHGGMMGMM
jgi:hypothetical protein